MNRAITPFLALAIALSLLACGDSGAGAGTPTDASDTTEADDATDDTTDARGEDDADTGEEADAVSDAVSDAVDDAVEVEDTADATDVTDLDLDSDAAATDVGGADAEEPDTGVTDVVEDVAVDAVEDAADATDAADTTDTGDAGDTSDTSDTTVECDYLDLSIAIVVCGDDYAYLREWTSADGPSRLCPTYYTLDAERFETLDDALNSRSCSDECVYAPSMSVTYLRCGVRSGYIIYRAEGRECGEVYEFAEGLYPSFEAYEAANPCP